jgi:hypothetical protein
MTDPRPSYGDFERLRAGGDPTPPPQPFDPVTATNAEIWTELRRIGDELDELLPQLDEMCERLLPRAPAGGW